MNKSNIFKSSEFFMSEGDTLSMLIGDETGTAVTINLVNSADDTTDVIADVSSVDYDGNFYPSVIINNLEWMTINLRTTHYNDGTAIPLLANSSDWQAEDGSPGHDGGYTWANNDSGNETPYGALYSYYATTNAHGLIPTGWRLPTTSEFLSLIAFLGGASLAGGILKEKGDINWLSPNTGASNDYGFSAVGSGMIDSLGSIAYFKEKAFMATDENDGGDWVSFFLSYDSVGMSSDDGYLGYSIRCVRDV